MLTEFGVEGDRPARPEAASARHDLLERGLWDGPDVGVVLIRSGQLLFSVDLVKTADRTLGISRGWSRGRLPRPVARCAARARNCESLGMNVSRRRRAQMVVRDSLA
jgi:hypothetical protein